MSRLGLIARLNDEADLCRNEGADDIAALLSEAAAALAASVPAEPIPKGWRLVPVEPTVGMCIAGDADRANVDDMTRTPAIYRAMLSAAPTAPRG